LLVSSRLSRPEEPPLSALLLPVYILLFVALIYWVGIRPQQKRRRQMEDLQARIKVGDDVMTTAGIYGRITEIEDDSTLLLEIAEDTDVRIAKSAVAEVVTEPSGE
jgi:preprotein translocase subunit YajC